MTKRIIYIFFIVSFCLPIIVWGQNGENSDTLIVSEEQSLTVNDNEINASASQERTFEAKILEITEKKEIESGLGEKLIFQKVKIVGLNGEWKDKQFISEEIEIDLALGKIYQIGDRVSVSVSQDAQGEDVFFVTDFIRRNNLYLLAAIFFIVILVVGRWRGFRAILGLVFSFFVILYFIVPKILAGADPLYISLVYSLLITLVGTYLVYGLNKKSSVSILGIFSGVVIVGVLSVVFTNFCRLAGFAQEETLFISSLTSGSIDLKGLLLAGFIIGALGVLDDLAVSQVSTVQELYKLNPNLSRLEVYKRAMSVGVDHISSMVNTLFLAYAGAALPLLLLFTFKQPPFLTVGQVLNHEVIATEIVRTLVGSIGLALAVPITTFFAAHFYVKRQK